MQIPSAHRDKLNIRSEPYIVVSSLNASIHTTGTQPLNEHIKWALSETIVCNVAGIYLFRAKIFIGEMVKFLLVVMISVTCTKLSSIILSTLSSEFVSLLLLIQMVSP